MGGKQEFYERGLSLRVAEWKRMKWEEVEREMAEKSRAMQGQEQNN